ncbi:MAG: hypothetical protein J5601_01775 [Elusimicrobiaceae bacterium]|nr:hypothetical protein [Elusimicrobiaceae bacterium]
MIKMKNSANFVVPMLIVLGIMGILNFSVWAAPTTQINKLNRVPTQVTEGESTAKPGTSSPDEQPFVPFLENVVNDQAARNGILANTYVLRTCRSYTTPEGAPLLPIQCNGGGATAVRIHKNWFLTSMHGLVDEVSPCPKWNGKKCVRSRKKEGPIAVSATQWNAPGTAAPFALIIDLEAEESYKTGKVYFLDPDAAFQNNTNLGRSNEGRGKDWALIYVPDQLTYLPAVANILPDSPYFSAASASLKKYSQDQAQVWQAFMQQKIAPIHLLAVSDKTIVQELSPFRFSVHDIHTYIKDKSGKFRTFKTFYRRPFGTRKNTNLILYESVSAGNEWLGGVSGGPIAYGEYVISVVSKQTASPMYSDLVHNWLQATMGRDYVKGLSVRVPEPPADAILTPVHHK